MDAQEVLKKYSARLESQINNQESQDYSQFKQDKLHEASRYERWAQSLGNIISIKPSDKDKLKIEKFLTEAHIDVNASQALSLSLITLLAGFFITLLTALSMYLITGTFPFLLTILGLSASLFIFYYVQGMPQRLANSWKLKASAQMVPAILYVVVYMKHTSNLERAIEFAAQHLEGPLALDFKKIFYDVQVGKYTTIKQSLDNYLDSWREYAPEFVESFHLIESSLFEPQESRRILILEKALQVILDGVYEKMLKYSREIRSPLTNIYMLGIILPTLALALLPLASTLLGGLIQWYHVVIIFNLIIPLFVFYMTSEVLLHRPGGYGESSILELNPKYSQFLDKKPWITSTLILIPCLILGLIPFILQIDLVTSTLNIQSDYTFGELGLPFFEDIKLFDFKNSGQELNGPFGPLGVILSLAIPFGIALFFSHAYKKKTSDLIKDRENTKKLEDEFTNSLFQLGNRLGDNVPAEIAFGRVAESSQGLNTQNFFSLVNQNIQSAGMSLDRALFDQKRGALTYFASPLIATSMRILVESVKKGLQVAAQSLMSISEYVKNINKINQRLRDLLAEVVSDMKSNMTFLAPLLSGIVVGLSVMITSILNRLQDIQGDLGAGENLGGLGGLGGIASIFDVSEIIPPYFLQIAVGLYIIQVIFILTKALVTVDSGQDTLREKADLAKNLITGTFLYLGAALVSIVTLTILSYIVLTQI